MAEIFLSATIDVLMEKLLSGDLINFASREGVDTSLKKLKGKLVIIKDVLADAEEMQITKDGVRIWLQDLRELAFDAEDVLDEITTEDKRRKLKAESEASTSTYKLPRLNVPSSFKPKVIKFNFTIKSKIEKITTRFQELLDRKSTMDRLGNNVARTPNKTRETPVNVPTTSLEEPYVRGRDEDKEAIVKLLLGGEASDDGFRVISIIGMGGAGKTTLARHVFNDDRVKASFNYLTAWVCVSEDFDFVRVTKAMLDSFTDEQTSGDKELEKLQNSLKNKLSKQKFLLVLDDVWPENSNIDWGSLCRPLMAGAPGSRIIVTTRYTNVSSIMALGIPQDYNLKALSHEDTKAIFFHHALGTRDLNEHPILKEIGEKIVLERCKGLPLAAKALGGLLRTKVDPKAWEEVLNSQIWALPEDKCGILPALRLSYHHLPRHLKPCFAFCSIYPKDYEFRKEKLVLLWMAASLVQQQGESKSMEDTGDEYFCDLLSRSFFQRSSINESRFVMHDLINDLAQWAAGETCFRLEDKKQHKDSKKVRHSSYTGGSYDGIKKFEAFHEFESLRTFLSIDTPSYSYLTRNVSLDLLPKFRCLRVLSLRGYCNIELPESIGNLKHLRYLDLSRSEEIRRLPRSTTTLYNLQTLILRSCSKLEMLPTEMGNLRDLCHLDITGANSIKEMPQPIGKLTSLRKLSNFIVGNGIGSAGLRELTNLKFLNGTLCISSLEKVMDVQDAIDAKLKDKQDLEVLTIEYSDKFNASRKERVEEEVLNMLEPPKKLTKLCIKYYGGTTLPTWLGNPSFSEMVVLRLENCIKCTSLPSLGQLPSLKDLCIQGMKEVKRVDIEFYGTSGCAKYFQSLKTLRFENMEEWKDWVDCFSTQQVEAFPCLRELSIKKCPKLSGKLPDHLPSLKKLLIKFY